MIQSLQSRLDEDGADLTGVSALESKDRRARRRWNSARGRSWPRTRRENAGGTRNSAGPWGRSDRRSAGRRSGRRTRGHRKGKDSNIAKVFLSKGRGKEKSSSSQESEGLHDGMDVGM